jgi:hypothetical protein
MAEEEFTAIGGGKKVETIETLIADCKSAMRRMSPHNPHRLLLHNCTLAPKQLCDRLYALEKPTEQTIVDSDPLGRVGDKVEKIDEILSEMGGKVGNA